MTKRTKWWLSGGIIIFIILVVSVPLPTQPPGDTRMILDHTLLVYAAPPCFNEADLTNNLAETTWDLAKQKGYEPESACTAEKMKPVSRTLWNIGMNWLGLSASPWAWQ
ncbi:hypothetical protein ACFQZE_23355 [Paenibacillus sp. GCM10027627]|uniref:hypothetical protein n=1 Tax=unclassified Paenibacillus TaxID=185978 RepID=UPI00363F609C